MRRNQAHAADPVTLERWLAGAEGTPYPLPRWTPIVSGVLGAIVAVAIGRVHTRVDNTLIGGLFTGFAAYRDPRATVASTLVVAVIEGAIWGVTDRTTPLIKEALMPSHEGGEAAHA
jgi:hypothetical protein